MEIQPVVVEQDMAFQQQGVMSKSVCFILSFGRYGIKKAVPKSKIRIAGKPASDSDPETAIPATDPTWYNLTKKIMESDLWERIKAEDTKIKMWVGARSVVPIFLKRGMYLVPITLAPQIKYKVQDYFEWRKNAVHEFAYGDYEKAKQAASEHLGSDFNELDYDTPDQVESKFKAVYRFTHFGSPTQLKNIAPEIIEEEMEKAKEQVSSIVEDIKSGLLTQFSQLTQHLVDAVTEKPDGTRKKFYGTTITNLVEYLDLLPFKNIVGFDALSQVADQAKKLLEGVSPELVKGNDAIRDKIKEDFTQITEQLKGMTESTERIILFDDEE